jgi:hypothetical protein
VCSKKFIGQNRYLKKGKFRNEKCAIKMLKNLTALVIGGCVCKNFFIVHIQGDEMSLEKSPKMSPNHF